MADEVLRLTGYLIVGTILVPCIVGLTAMFVGAAADCWREWRAGEGRQNLAGCVFLTWLLVITLMLYAGGAMKLWEEWHG